MYVYNYLCGSVAKASDTQAVGHGSEPRPPDDVRTINYCYKMGLKILFRSYLI